jgi:hypothetical protein
LGGLRFGVVTLPHVGQKLREVRGGNRPGGARDSGPIWAGAATHAM